MPATVPSQLKIRMARVTGRLWSRFLSRAEQFAYDVAGLPMAVRYVFRPLAPSATQSPADYLHWVHGRSYWALPAGPLRGLIATVAWPVALIVAAALFTRRNGSAIRRESGKPIGRQLSEQLQLAAGPSIAPFWYYMFELYRDGRRRNAGLYLTAHETVGSAYALLQPTDRADLLADKAAFARDCARLGIRAVPVHFHLSGGKPATTDGTVPALPASDLFVKPRRGNGGHHCERWDYLGEDRYRNSSGETLGGEALLARLERQSLTGDIVVQPRLENHPELADISNGALATARILTCRNEEDGFEATNAAFRMAIGSNCVVDNFHQGGLATAVDLNTGEIGPASDMGIRPGVGWNEIHPVSGARFAGRRLPLWKEVVELACRTHAAFPQLVVVGWDVAMLADGACIIEGNSKPDLDIHQRVERRPLGDQRIARLLAYRLTKRVDAGARQGLELARGEVDA